MSDSYFLTLFLLFLPVIIGAPTICCCLCRRCCRRERNGLPYSYFPSNSSSSSDSSSLSSSRNLLNANEIDPLTAFPPLNGLVDDRVVYVYQYNPNGEEFAMGTEGGNAPGLINGRPQPAYGGNGRYYVPQMPLIPHPPYYDDEPPKYEDIVDLSVLGGNSDNGVGGSSSANQDSSIQIEMEPYRDEVDDENDSNDEDLRENDDEQGERENDAESNSSIGNNNNNNNNNRSGGGGGIQPLVIIDDDM